MSRRRKPPKPSTGGAVRVLVECSGSKFGPHTPYRIARCTTWTEPYTPGVVSVDYVHDADRIAAADARARFRGVAPSLRAPTDDFSDLHTTWPLRCGVCGRYVPLMAVNLSHLVALAGVAGTRRVELSAWQR